MLKLIALVLEQFEMNIAVSKRMGESPDLGSLIAEANQYG